EVRHGLVRHCQLLSASRSVRCRIRGALRNFGTTGRARTKKMNGRGEGWTTEAQRHREITEKNRRKGVLGCAVSLSSLRPRLLRAFSVSQCSVVQSAPPNPEVDNPWPFHYEWRVSARRLTDQKGTAALETEFG